MEKLKPKFKVGDWLEVTEKFGEKCKHSSHNRKVGETFQVLTIWNIDNEYHPCPVYGPASDNHSGVGEFECCLKLIESEDLRVGDIVRVNSHTKSFFPSREGQIGTIKQLAGLRVWIGFENRDDDSGFVDELTLISRAVKGSTANNTSQCDNKKGNIMTDAVKFIKNKVLKATDPDEFALREAGLVDECGNFTSDGGNLHAELLKGVTRDEMVTIAKDIIATVEAKKK